MVSEAMSDLHAALVIAVKLDLSVSTVFPPTAMRLVDAIQTGLGETVLAPCPAHRASLKRRASVA